MTPGTPTVSAVIPVHNGEQFLADAISSVLGQSHTVLECLVVDDGSTDATPDVAAGFGELVTYLRQEQAGVSAARNHGARAARGDFLAFLDHDDVWLPEKLTLQLEALGSSTRAMALCAVRLVDAELHVIGERHLRSPNDLLTGMLTFDRTDLVSCSSSGVLSRASFLDIGGFDPELSMSADWDFLVRVLLSSGIAYVDEPLSLYRTHGTNMSRHIDLMEHDMVRAFEKAFADPRLPPALRDNERLAYARLYRMLAGSYRDVGAWIKAVQMVLKGLARSPLAIAELMRPGATVDRPEMAP